MNDDFNKERAVLIRDLADKADPITRKWLLDLSIRYEAGLSAKTGPLPLQTKTKRIPKPRDSVGRQGNGLSGTGGYAEAGSKSPARGKLKQNAGCRSLFRRH
ncbi:hypothetical protein [Bradyrhizobium sp. LTSP857]|uniref:hypothetical protein n=1 Tax=Bradyrhizobium sp. LTSP857 TaxID=1619231 RepID=UPI0005D24867|nr:hypothetical protein [Bradyrhizobium sp. LTSP857]